MFSKKIAAVGLCIGMSSLLIGCEQETTKDQVANAQFCLDKATDASSANACVAKIASIDTPTANALRCSAGFIAAGVTKSENLSKALNAIKDSNNGGSNATTMMSFLNLGTNTQAKSIFNNCVASQNKGMALVAAMAKSATTLVNLMGTIGTTVTYDPTSGNPPDPEQLKEVIDGLVASPNTDALEAIGSSISTVYQVTCSGSSGNSDICHSIDDALANYNSDPSNSGNTIDLSSSSPDPLEIGQALLAFWKKQNTP